MKKMILVFVMLLGLGFVNVSTNNFVKYDSNNFDLLDFEDSGEPEYILLNSSLDSNKQISQFHNPLDLGSLAKFEDSGEPEFVPTRSFV